jgi:SAM-dependent methyltransferase
LRAPRRCSGSIWKSSRREPARARRFVSIGSGNGSLEIELAQQLRARGHSQFVIDCLDINPAMLERGRAVAKQSGVEAHIRCLHGDFNQWEPGAEYDAVLACQALHHVVNLEGLFAQIRAALAPHGRFIISDIIGRNGHRRWPEALQFVREFWSELPQSYRFNRVRQAHEELFINRDASAEGFEGIRSQDILPPVMPQTGPNSNCCAFWTTGPVWSGK